MPKVILHGFRCHRCDHEWLPRDANRLPTVCPGCKSPYWNTPRSNRAKRNGSTHKKATQNEKAKQKRNT